MLYNPILCVLTVSDERGGDGGVCDGRQRVGARERRAAAQQRRRAAISTSPDRAAGPPEPGHPCPAPRSIRLGPCAEAASRTGLRDRPWRDEEEERKGLVRGRGGGCFLEETAACGQAENWELTAGLGAKLPCTGERGDPRLNSSLGRGPHVGLGPRVTGGAVGRAAAWRRWPAADGRRGAARPGLNPHRQQEELWKRPTQPGPPQFPGVRARI